MFYVEMYWWQLLICIVLITLPSLVLAIGLIAATIEDIKNKRKEKKSKDD